jgi:hypothetical protein
MVFDPRARIPRVRLAALLALATLAPLAFSPGALAQAEPTLVVYWEDPGSALMPGTEEAVQVRLNYQPGTGGRPAPTPTPDRPEQTQPTRVVITAKQIPSWVTAVRFDPPDLFIQMPFQNLSTAYRSEAIAYLTVAPDAPALVREVFLITASAEANGNIPAMTAESPPDTRLRAQTLGKVNVTADEVAIVPGGRWTTIPFTVRNEGNSEILAKINVTVRPENSQVEFVDTLQLAHGATQVVEVRLRTPWTNAELGTLELEAVPIVDGEAVAGSRAEVLVRGQSAVPFPGAGALVALVAVLALARRAARGFRGSAVKKGDDRCALR